MALLLMNPLACGFLQREQGEMAALIEPYHVAHQRTCTQVSADGSLEYCSGEEDDGVGSEQRDV